MVTQYNILIYPEPPSNHNWDCPLPDGTLNTYMQKTDTRMVQSMYVFLFFLDFMSVYFLTGGFRLCIFHYFCIKF